MVHARRRFAWNGSAAIVVSLCLMSGRCALTCTFLPTVMRCANAFADGATAQNAVTMIMAELFMGQRSLDVEGGSLSTCRFTSSSPRRYRLPLRNGCWFE